MRFAFRVGVAVALAATMLRAQDLSIDVQVAATEVEFGRAFGLTVRRAWPETLVPDPWNDALLAPLRLRLENLERAQRAGRVEETRNYQAYAFRLDAVDIAAPVFRARMKDGSREQTASGAPIPLRVKPALPAGAPGAAEFPGEPRAEPWSWARALIAILIIVGFGFGAFRGLRFVARRRAARTAAAPPPEVRARAELARLRGRLAAGDVAADVAAFQVELSQVVRCYVEERCEIRPPGLTTSEFLAAAADAPALSPRDQEFLREFLTSCDDLKFGQRRPDATGCAQLLDQAEALVRGTTAPPDSAAAP